MAYRKLSVIIPVYNENRTIEKLIDRVHMVHVPLEKEIVVVDDGSDDGTRESLIRLKPRIDRLIFLEKNKGKGAAVRAGLKIATGDILLIQDADLELNPEEYGILLEPILEGKAEVVFGSRFILPRYGISLSRKLANRFLTYCTNCLYGSDLTDMETAYKVFTSHIAKQVHLVSDRFEIEPEITSKILRLGIQIREVPISYHPRSRDEGKKIRFQDGIHALFTLIRWKFLS